MSSNQFGLNSSLFEKYQEPTKGPRIEYSFQDIGVQMEAYFKSKLIWVTFHNKNYTETMIRDAFIACQKRGIADIRYFYGVLNRIKNENKKQDSKKA